MLGDETDVIFNALRADESKALKVQQAEREGRNHARSPTFPGYLEADSTKK